MILFDEADQFTLEDPDKFAKLIKGFTATPDNCDPKGAQRMVVDSLIFSRHNYVLDAPADEPVRLDVDEIVTAPSVKEKAYRII